MPYNLTGRNVLVTAGSRYVTSSKNLTNRFERLKNPYARGLGALVCEKFAAKKCNIAINYFSRPEPAQELSKRTEQEYGVKTTIIQGDGGKLEDCKFMVNETIKQFGGLDVIVSNAVRLFNDTTQMLHDWNDIDIACNMLFICTTYANRTMLGVYKVFKLQ